MFLCGDNPPPPRFPRHPGPPSAATRRPAPAHHLPGRRDGGRQVHRRAVHGADQAAFLSGIFQREWRSTLDSPPPQGGGGWCPSLWARGGLTLGGLGPTPFWQQHGEGAVIIEADAFKMQAAGGHVAPSPTPPTGCESPTVFYLFGGGDKVWDGSIPHGFGTGSVFPQPHTIH